MMENAMLYDERFIPYRDREKHCCRFLATLVEVTIGKGFDKRTLGWLRPEAA